MYVGRADILHTCRYEAEAACTYVRRRREVPALHPSSRLQEREKSPHLTHLAYDIWNTIQYNNCGPGRPGRRSVKPRRWNWRVENAAAGLGMLSGNGGGSGSII